MDGVQIIIQLCWNLLVLTPACLKNPVLAVLLPTSFVLVNILSNCLTLAPGVLDAVQSPVPPTVAFFRNLPTKCYKLWAVYAITLAKSGCRSKIYIGVGTNSENGVSDRLVTYETLDDVLPKYVAKAVDDGYRVVHRGLLCWAPMPNDINRIPLRAAFLLLEGFFSLYFWAMRSRISDYGMPRFCPWTLDDFEYDGLCSHVCLYEKIQGEQAGLTTDQMVQLEVERAAKAREAMRLAQGELDGV